MKTWVVAYKDKNNNGNVAKVIAPTYTMAIVQFMMEYPNCDYIAFFQLTPYGDKV